MTADSQRTEDANLVDGGIDEGRRNEIGRQIAQRHQHEGALEHARVRHYEIGFEHV